MLEIDVTSPEQLRRGRRGAGGALGPSRRAAARHRLRAARLPGQRHVRRRLGRRRRSALHVSTYSLKALVDAFLPAARGGRAADGGASVVGLDFDATVAWPVYDWMGVAKAALESLSRYLAKELGPRGIRVNLVAAGPGPDHGGQVDPGLQRLRGHLGASGRRSAGTCTTSTPVAKACVALFSDLFPMTTGEILHVDGGVHAVGGSA